MEKDVQTITMVEQDMIRLAGGCILSIAVCSVLLMVPLLPCYTNGKIQPSDSLNAVFALRLLLFLHGKIALEILYACNTEVCSNISATMFSNIRTCIRRSWHVQSRNCCRESFIR